MEQGAPPEAAAYLWAGSASRLGRAVAMAAVAMPITELHSSSEPLHSAKDMTKKKAIGKVTQRGKHTP